MNGIVRETRYYTIQQKVTFFFYIIDYSVFLYNAIYKFKRSSNTGSRIFKEVLITIWQLYIKHIKVLYQSYLLEYIELLRYNYQFNGYIGAITGIYIPAFVLPDL